MNDLVISKSGRPVTTSVLVAQKFGKQHKHVLDAIRNIIDSTTDQPAEFSARRMFADGQYIDSKGESRPMIIMDRDGFSLLVMGFTGKEALKFKLDFINAFNEMEKRMQALPTTPEEMLLQSVQLMVEQKRKLYEVENRVRAIEAKTATTPDYFAVMGYASLNGIKVGLNLAAQIGRRAKKICAENGYPIETIPDPRFGRVHTYPYSVLETAFKQTTI